MTKEEIESITQDDIIRVMDEYRNGTRTRKSALQFLCELLENYIKSRCVQTGRLNGAEMDDLLQSGYESVCMKFEDYDPRKAMPTSFFTPYIDEYTKGQCRHSNPRSQYYTSLITKLNRAAVSSGYEGMMDARLPEDTLATIADVPLHSVIEAKKYATYTIVHSDAGELTEGASFETPEKALVTKTENELLLDSLLLLSPIQKWVIARRHFDEECMSYRCMIGIIKDDCQLKKFFEKESQITSVYLEQIYNDGIRILKNSKGLKDLAGYAKKKPVIEYVAPAQASDKELETAILSGFIEL